MDISSGLVKEDVLFGHAADRRSRVLGPEERVSANSTHNVAQSRSFVAVIRRESRLGRPSP